jgi:uncharacterized protein involved in copper resistance
VGPCDFAVVGRGQRRASGLQTRRRTNLGRVRSAGHGAVQLRSRGHGVFGEGGQSALRLEGDYDILLTNRLILQPTAELNVYGKNDPQRGLGSGLSNTEAGLRLRYEIRREFAPYSA